MKFLFLSSYAHLVLDPATQRVSGGAELQVALLARELAARGHEVVIVGGDHGQEDGRVLEGVRTRVGGKFQTGGVADTLTALPRVYRIIRQELPDHILLCGWTAWLLFLLGARAFEADVSFICGSDAEVDGRYRSANPLRGGLFEAGLRYCDARFAMSEHQRALFEKAGLTCSMYRNLILPRQSPRTAEKDIDLLWISRCQALKQPHLFLDLAERLPEARCTIICPNEDDELWQSVRDRSATLANVTFIESVPYREVQAYYDRAKLVVNTSEFEGFPNAFIQAGQGDAAILSLNVDPDRVITQFEAGFYAGGDFERFVEGARALLSDGKRLSQAQTGAARFVTEWHDNGRNVDAFLSGLPKARSQGSTTAEECQA